MPSVVSCSSCGQRMGVPDNAAKVQCPHCKAVIVVPAMPAPAAAPSTPTTATKPPAQPAPAPATPPAGTSAAAPRQPVTAAPQAAAEAPAPAPVQTSEPVRKTSPPKLDAAPKSAIKHDTKTSGVRPLPPPLPASGKTAKPRQSPSNGRGLEICLDERDIVKSNSLKVTLLILFIVLGIGGLATGGYFIWRAFDDEKKPDDLAGLGKDFSVKDKISVPDKGLAFNDFKDRKGFKDFPTKDFPFKEDPFKDFLKKEDPKTEEPKKEEPKKEEPKKEEPKKEEPKKEEPKKEEPKKEEPKKEEPKKEEPKKGDPKKEDPKLKDDLSAPHIVLKGKGEVIGLRFSKDGKTLVSLHGGGTVIWWDVEQ